MTHECGHAFRDIWRRKILSGNMQISEWKLREIHSMSMEFFTEPWYHLFFDKDTTEDYTRMHLEEAVMFVPYGCMVDEFQHEVYDHPEMRPPGAEEVWKKLEKVYRPIWITPACPFLKKGLSGRNSTISIVSLCTILTMSSPSSCAFEYKAWMDRDYKAAWKSYLKLCRMSASKFHTELLKRSRHRLSLCRRNHRENRGKSGKRSLKLYCHEKIDVFGKNTQKRLFWRKRLTKMQILL